MHSHSLVTLLLLATLVAFLAEGDPLLDAPSQPLELADARTGGPSPRFLFLPPIADVPVLADVEADGTLAPEVVICSWDGRACTGEAEWRLRVDGEGSERLRVAGGHFRGVWLLPTRPSARLYRLRVLLAGEVLGWVDVLCGKQSGMQIGASPPGRVAEGGALSEAGGPGAAPAGAGETIVIAGAALPIEFLIGR